MELHDTQTCFGNISGVALFDYPMELHDTQTVSNISFIRSTFDYPMELHDTQTASIRRNAAIRLITLWNYTTLKQYEQSKRRFNGLITLWNYTTLKLIGQT